jgi:anti-anti-sigma regulatory factor
MSTATTLQPHIAYDLIEDANHQVMVISFLIHDIAGHDRARELGQELNLLIRPPSRQYFVIDFAGVRALGTDGLSEVLSFVRRARPVWICNLDETLRLAVSLIGVNNWAKFAADRRAAINEAERTARWDEEDSLPEKAHTVAELAGPRISFLWRRGIQR